MEEVCEDDIEINNLEDETAATEICDDAEQTQYADGSLD